MTQEFAHPRVVVGVADSLCGLAAVRAAVAEARHRGVPLHAVRAHALGRRFDDLETIMTTLLDALGVIPTDLEIHLMVSPFPVLTALELSADDPRDLIVVGTSGKGFWRTLWSGSVSRRLTRWARCPVMAVPAPEMSRALRTPYRWSRRGRQDLWQQIYQEAPELRTPRRIEG